MDIFSNRLKKFFRNFLNDEFEIAEQFQGSFGRPINFIEPKTFNEKIQVQKLYNRDSRMTDLIDKYKVREYIEKNGYKELLNDLIGVYDSPEEIDFEALPDRFVIKCNHSWATNIICNDKNVLDFDESRKQLKNWLLDNHYLKFREWAYKDIDRKIIIERHLGDVLTDYKFFCFDGMPAYIQVDSERFGEHTLDLYDTSWNRIDCKKGNKKQSSRKQPRPAFLDDMLVIAERLSWDFNFCRIDLLATAEALYFGEITFYPGGGLSRFEPDSYDHLFAQNFKTNQLAIPLTSKLKLTVIKMINRFKLR